MATVNLTTQTVKAIGPFTGLSLSMVLNTGRSIAAQGVSSGNDTLISYLKSIGNTETITVDASYSAYKTAIGSGAFSNTSNEVVVLATNGVDELQQYPASGWNGGTSVDCSANPNYPATSANTYYVVSVSGKIGGASGKTVSAGDVVYCNTTNGGGNEATVGSYYTVIPAATFNSIKKVLKCSGIVKAVASASNSNHSDVFYDPNDTGVPVKLTVEHTLAELLTLFN